jgi:hypothetical protein
MTLSGSEPTWSTQKGQVVKSTHTRSSPRSSKVMVCVKRLRSSRRLCCSARANTRLGSAGLACRRRRSPARGACPALPGLSRRCGTLAEHLAGVCPSPQTVLGLLGLGEAHLDRRRAWSTRSLHGLAASPRPGCTLAVACFGALAHIERLLGPTPPSADRPAVSGRPEQRRREQHDTIKLRSLGRWRRTPACASTATTSETTGWKNGNHDSCTRIRPNTVDDIHGVVKCP